MPETITILCATFLLVLVVYWIMPIKKMKAVNASLISLLQILPISKIIGVIRSQKKHEEMDK